MEFLLVNLAEKAREAKLDGRDYLVVPATMIVPGVLNGSQGPLYYPPDEIARNFDAWDGIPVVVNHPRDPVTNEHVRARQPEIVEKFGIGTIFNAFIDKGGELKAEAWIDVAKANRVEPRIVRSLAAGKPLELSTGLKTDNAAAPKNFRDHDGKPLAAGAKIARNYRPDHLAVLPDQKGACSLNDGCGLNVNEERGDIELTPSLLRRMKDWFNDVLSFNAVVVTRCPNCQGEVDEGVCQECGYRYRPEPDATTKALLGSNSFCSTGEGGGIDPSCGTSQGRSISGLAETGAGGGKTLTNGTKVRFKTGTEDAGRTAKIVGVIPMRYKNEQVTYRLEIDGLKGGLAQTTRTAKSLMKGAELIDNVENAGRYGNVQSKNTGKYKPYGAGTGKGIWHDRAQLGAAQPTDHERELGRDARAQAEAGQNPASWVEDEATWERAKEAAGKGDYGEGTDTYWAVVTHVYKNMGGGVKSTNNESGAEQGDQEVKLNEKQRERIVGELTANCDCWKDDDAADVLNEMSDERLVKLLKAHQRGSADAVVANAAREELEIPEDLAANEMPAFIKKKIAAKEGDDKEDEEEEEEAKNKAPAANAKPKKRLTENEWLERAPPEVQETHRAAKQLLTNEKKRVVDRLVANIKDDKRRNERGNALMRQPLEALNEMLELLPPTRNARRDDEDDAPKFFFGRSGGGRPAVRNEAQEKAAEGDADDLALPTFNEEEIDARRKELKIA